MLASLLMISASGAFAADNAVLEINGMVAPAGCDVTFSNADLDLGRVTRSMLSETARTELPNQTFTYNIVCSAAGPIQHSWADEKPNTSPDPLAFGLGAVQGAKKIGGYKLQMGALTSDPTLLSIVSINGGAWSGTPVISPLSTARHSFSARAGTAIPIPLTVAAGSINVKPFIDPVAGVDFSSEFPLEGQATMTVSYL